MHLSPGTMLGPYQIETSLGAGGMGEVYKARDTRLGRVVAVKVLGERVAHDADLRRRFEREARAIAALNHPHICALYDIGSSVVSRAGAEPGAVGEAGDGTVVFLVMEMLEGNTLAEELLGGPLTLTEAVQHGVTLLGTLDVLHRRGFVHRDLKPANIVLTPHGLKLLDFGLVRSLRVDPGRTDADLTQPGSVLGTPRYMAPEAIRGEPVEPRADLFAVGAMLYEMLTGKPAFDGASTLEIAHAVVHDRPPMLSGSVAIMAVDRVIHRALAKRPEDRHENAALMSRDLENVLAASDVGTAVSVRQMPRLIVLPFRMLRPDPDTDFLAFSLPDAITTSLSGLPSLVVRSALAGGPVSHETPDLHAIARQADVDLILVGTLLRGGQQLQVNAQLVEAPAGTVIWSQRSQVAWQDIFQVQDELTRRIVDSLAQPLASGERQRLGRDVPANAAAYEHYLRANELARTPREWTVARDLYLQCVDQDPGYAPAWAQLGRMHRVIVKYSETGRREDELAEGYRQAEAALQRSLALNPDLSQAHNLYTPLELERGRALSAMLRLLQRIATSPSDAQLFAGLVPACRYCGLIDASLAAHDRARRLDPDTTTAVVFSLKCAGRYEEAVQTAEEQLDVVGVTAECLMRLGRTAEAIARLDQALTTQSPATPWYAFLRALADRPSTPPTPEDRRVWTLAEHGFDPEAYFLWATYWAQLGDHAQAMSYLSRAVQGGFFCFPAIVEDPWLDPLRAEPEFSLLLGVAETRHTEAAAAFAEAGGNALLGLS